MIGFYVFLFIVVMSILGFATLVWLIRDELNSNGFVTLGDTLLIGTLLLCPLVNIGFMLILLRDAGIMDKKLFVKKTPKQEA